MEIPMGTQRKDIEAAIAWAAETGRKVVSVEFAEGDGKGIKTVEGVKCAAVEGVGLSRAVLDTGSHMHLEGLADRYVLKHGIFVADDEAEAVEAD
jgi:hypothetical protein